MSTLSSDDTTLHSLFRDLRKDYGLVPQQLARALIILSEGRDAGISGAELALLLTPILASTAEQQRDLQARLGALFAIAPARSSEDAETTSALGQDPAHANGPIGPGPPDGRKGDGERQSKQRWAWLGVLALALIALGITIYVLGHQQGGNGPNNPAPSPNSTFVSAAPNTAYRLIATAIGAAPVLLVAGWWFVRRRRVRTLRFDGHEEIGLDRLDLGARTFEHRLFSGREVAQSARGWRRFRRVATVELDSELTIAATISRGGLFTPVMATRPLSPDYFVLIEDTGRHDHVARLADNLVNRLVDEGISIRRFYYEDGFANLREDQAPPGHYVRLAQTVAATDRETLVIVGSGAELFDPLTERPNEKLLDDLGRWPRRIFLSTRPITAWSHREQGLVDADFAIATLGVRGIEAAGAHIARGFPLIATPLEGQREMSGATRRAETESVASLVALIHQLQVRVGSEMETSALSRGQLTIAADLGQRIERGDIAGLLRLLDGTTVPADGVQDLVAALRQRLALVSTQELGRLRETLIFQKSGLADLSGRLRQRLAGTLSQLERQNPGIRFDKIEQVAALLDRTDVTGALREIEGDARLRASLEADHLLAEILHRLAERTEEEEDPRKGAETPFAKPMATNMAAGEPLRARFWPRLIDGAPLWIRQYFERVPLLALILGMSSGFPIALIGATLTTRLAQDGIDKKAVTAFTLAFLIYNLKWLWAWVVDGVRLPLLGKLGQRVSWMLLAGCLVIAAVANLALVDPTASLLQTAYAATLVGAAGATFDIVIDAYRIEQLKPEQLGVGSGMSQFGWRIGSVAAGTLALVLAARIGWPGAYLACVVFALPAMLTALLLGEPERPSEPLSRRGLGEVWQSIAGPLLEFFQRRGALLVLLFILLHKIGDMLANLTFRLLFNDLGYSNDEVAIYDVGIGFWAYLIGIFVGGILYARMGMKRSVLLSVVLMGVSNLSFAALAALGKSNGGMAGAIGFENFASGIGGVTVVAYISALCELRFTAAQYALISAAASIVGRFLTVTTAGRLIEQFGYVNFYLLTAALALPGIFLFWWMIRAGLIDASVGSAASSRSRLTP